MPAKHDSDHKASTHQKRTRPLIRPLFIGPSTHPSTYNNNNILRIILFPNLPIHPLTTILILSTGLTLACNDMIIDCHSSLPVVALGLEPPLAVHAVNCTRHCFKFFLASPKSRRKRELAKFDEESRRAVGRKAVNDLYAYK